MSSSHIKNKALELRGKGMSYSQIKTSLGISKSTLSGWLKDIPLTKEQLQALRDSNHLKIEKTRATKKLNKDNRRKAVYEKVALDIENNNDSLFISGFFLYWGEGTKTAEYTVSFTNSDPSMVRFFIYWMSLLGISKNDLRVKLHLYNNQKEAELINFWSQLTEIPVTNFNKSYIKKTDDSKKNYQGLFGYGTCVVAYHNRDIYEYVLEGIRYLRNKFSKK